MYMKLLEETVRELKGEDIEDDLRATVNLRVDLKIDESVHPRHEPAAHGLPADRVGAQRGRARSRAVAEVRDRYGPLPTSMLNLADYGRIRVMADRLGVETVDREATVVFRFRPQTRLDPERLLAIVERRADVTLVPPGRPAARPARRAGTWPSAGRAVRPAGAAAAQPGRGPATPNAAARRRGGPADSAGAPVLVDGPGDGRRGDARVHQGRNPQAGRRRPARPTWRLYSGGWAC